MSTSTSTGVVKNFRKKIDNNGNYISFPLGSSQAYISVTDPFTSSATTLQDSLSNLTTNTTTYLKNNLVFSSATTATQGSAGLVPAPSTATTDLYVDNVRSEYWLNANGNWQQMPDASFTEKGIMSPAHYTLGYIKGMAGYWQNMNSRSAAANTWLELQSGTIPENTTDFYIAFKIVGICSWASAATSVLHRNSIYFDDAHNAPINEYPSVNWQSHYIRDQAICIMAPGDTEKAIFWMGNTGTAGTIEFTKFYFEPIAWWQ